MINICNTSSPEFYYRFNIDSVSTQASGNCRINMLIQE